MSAEPENIPTHPRRDPVTPDEHYARGLELLDTAEKCIELGPLQANAVLAQTHFQAATSGTGIEAMKQMAIGERARAVAEHRARNEARLVNALEAIEALTKDTDGGDIDGAVDIPIGEIRRVLAGHLAAQSDTEAS